MQDEGAATETQVDSLQQHDVVFHSRAVEGLPAQRKKRAAERENSLEQHDYGFAISSSEESPLQEGTAAETEERVQKHGSGFGTEAFLDALEAEESTLTGGVDSLQQHSWGTNMWDESSQHSDYSMQHDSSGWEKGLERQQGDGRGNQGGRLRQQVSEFVTEHQQLQMQQSIEQRQLQKPAQSSPPSIKGIKTLLSALYFFGLVMFYKASSNTMEFQLNLGFAILWLLVGAHRLANSIRAIVRYNREQGGLSPGREGKAAGLARPKNAWFKIYMKRVLLTLVILGLVSVLPAILVAIAWALLYCMSALLALGGLLFSFLTNNFP